MYRERTIPASESYRIAVVFFHITSRLFASLRLKSAVEATAGLWHNTQLSRQINHPACNVKKNTS